MSNSSRYPSNDCSNHPTDERAERRDPGSAHGARSTDLEQEVDGLRKALETRPLIDLAKGMVMHRYQCGDAAAFALLRRFSQEHNIKIRDLAAAIVGRVDEAEPAEVADEVAAVVARLFDGDRGDGLD